MQKNWIIPSIIISHRYWIKRWEKNWWHTTTAEILIRWKNRDLGVSPERMENVTTVTYQPVEKWVTTWSLSRSYYILLVRGIQIDSTYSHSGTQRSLSGVQCKPKHFECMPGECIPSPWVCDGEEVYPCNIIS